MVIFHNDAIIIISIIGLLSRRSTSHRKYKTILVTFLLFTWENFNLCNAGRFMLTNQGWNESLSLVYNERDIKKEFKLEFSN